MKDASPINRLPLAEQTYRLLLTSIIAGKHAAGDRISEESISAEFGISRTPAREALMRLAADGFIERTARRGCRIARRDKDEIRDIVECRAHLEALALSLAFDAVPDAAITKLETMLSDTERMNDTAAAMDADDMLHDLVTAHCPNRTLAALVESLRRRCKAARAVRAASVDARVVADERRAIVSAIRSKDRTRAQALLHAHIMAAV